MASTQEFLALYTEVPALVLQYLRESGFKDTAYTLEQEASIFFDVNHVCELVRNGKWSEVETYLSSFIKINDGATSCLMFWHIRKQKFLEALEEKNIALARTILNEEIKVFSPHLPQQVEGLGRVLAFDDLGSSISNIKNMRMDVARELQSLIRKNPALGNKLVMPNRIGNGLLDLIQQGIHWENIFDNERERNANVTTLVRNDAQIPQSIQALANASAGASSSRSARANESLPFVNASAGASSSRSARANEDIGEPSTKRQAIDENVQPTMLCLASPLFPNTFGAGGNREQGKLSLPRALVRTFYLMEDPISMDFCPTRPTILLVGTNKGQIQIWEVNTGEQLFSEKFPIPQPESRSTNLLEALRKDLSDSITRVVWNADGDNIFGVASSRNLVRVYRYNGGKDNVMLVNEFNAHERRVSDIGFVRHSSKPVLYLLTGGEDKLLKVWNVARGEHIYTYIGHEAPITCLYPLKDHVISASTDGSLRVWVYRPGKSHKHFQAVNNSCTRFTCTQDGKRMFSCWMNPYRQFGLHEMCTSLGLVRMTYGGLQQPTVDTVSFDVLGNRFLACGHDHAIKYWDLDDPIILDCVKVDGKLPACPKLKANREGSLLVVSGANSVIYILGNPDGQALCPSVRTFGSVGNLELRVEQPKDLGGGSTSCLTGENEEPRSA